MRVRPSALKHGLDETEILQAAGWPLWIEDLDDGHPSRQLRIGFDTHGRLLEVVVLVFDSGNELIIHAMKARSQYTRLLE